MGGFENQHNAEPSTQDIKERGEEDLSELDRETSQKEEPWKDKVEIVKDTLRKHLEQNPEKKKDEGYLKKLTAIDPRQSRDDGILLEPKTSKWNDEGIVLKPEAPQYRDDGIEVTANPRTPEKKEATTKLGEITPEQLKQAIKNMPDEILVEAKPSKNPAMGLQTATTDLRSEIDKSIMHALNVKEGTFDSSSVAQWAIEKVRTLDREDVIQGTKIQISEEEKRKLLQDFIHANQ